MGFAGADAAGALFGRGRDLGRLRRALKRHALVTIWGPPGVGKTRLATELAQRWPGDAWSCDLTQARDGGAFVSALARALGVTGDAAALGAFLGRRAGALVVLDNFDHLFEAGREGLGALRTAAPALRFVVTSRAPLAREDELVFELEPLPVPQPGEDPLGCPAVQLLLERAGSRQRHDPAALAEVARRLDGLPLAIELAAARMRLVGLDGLLALFPSRLDALTARQLPPRHRTMRAALEWSWRLLAPAQARALARSAVFAGSFDAAAAEAVLGGGALRDLEELVDRALVRIERPGRMALYEVIREFATDKLAELGEREAAELAREAYYLALAREQSLRFEARGAIDAALGDELDNLVAVADRAEASGRLEAATAAALALGPLLTTRGLAAVHRSRLERLVEMRESLPGETRARLLHARGHARYLTGEYPGARRDLEAALEASNDRVLAATIHKDLGWVHHAGRQLGDARACYEQALALLPEGEADRLRGVLIGNLGAIDHDRGRFETAAASYRRALTLFRGIGDTRLEGIFTTNLGVLEAEEGAVAAARSRYRRALRLLGDGGDARLVGITLGNLALLEHAEGALAASRGLYEQALASLVRVGEPRSEALCRARLAAVLAGLGESADAEAELDDAAALVRDRDELTLAVVRMCRAFVDVACGRPDAALACVAEARAPDGSPLGEVSDDARALLRILTRSLNDEIAPALEVGEECEWFRAPGARAQDLRSYASMRRMFAELVARRECTPGSPMDIHALFAAGWPAARIAPESAANRVYVTLAKLRKLGLKAWLVHDSEGYALDPKLGVRRSTKRFDALEPH